MIQNILSKILSTRNQRMLNKYKKQLNAINSLEVKYQSLSDDELKLEFDKLKKHTKNKFDEIGSEALNFALVESFAITREASKRILNMRHFDVQLIGAMVLHEGKIAEMKTGEGKTLVATLAASLNAMSGKSVHVVTVNDYLARRDAMEMRPLYEFLGYSVGIVVGDERDESNKLEQYSCNVIYGTNNEFGFDYLRDNMKFSLSNQFQKDHFFAIVDEVDSILIDEARTPLIISGPANRKLENYGLANSVAQKMIRDTDFSIDEKSRTILISESGIKKAEEFFNVDNLYNVENAFLAHHLDQALKANFLFQKDKDYIVRDGEVIIVDEFTGRLSEGRRFSDGLHQAIEAKELVDIKEETQTLADITFQNYFRMYEKLSGMTGTAQTEATEFLQIYKLDVVSIPTNVPNIRKDYNDLIFKSEVEKFDAVCKKIVELHKQGIPVLIGTASIEKSEKLHELLKKQRIPHTVLNAKHHTKEAEIIKDAGKKGAVTIATNMAGRGVDIKIDKEVMDLGGLFIIGTERHESRRIDNQLRGRSGRQGDPGASQFYLSLEDNLLRIFGSDKIKGVMEKLGLKDGEHIESSFITRSIENAQKKVESMHFESRKHVLEYDDVANEQRKIIYQFRNKLLDENYDLSQKIKEDREFSIQNIFLNYDFIQEDNIDKVSITNKILEDFGSKVVFDNTANDISLLQDQAILKLQDDYNLKMSSLNDAQRKEIERIVYLQVLDNTWREHLYTMDNLKTGIGLRGYNQKDPLIEYKKESYDLFLELKDNLKIESSKMIHMIRLRGQSSDDEEQAKAILKNLEEENNNDIFFNKDNVENEVKKNTKVARNDPCPCGSGKKYKVCHGKSGPKKGILAN